MRLHQPLGSLIAIAFIIALSMTSVSAQARYAGRPLVDVLREMQASGVKVVYSSELVRPDLRVTSEPRSRSPRRMLDELLNPHGLEIRGGPNGTLLIVESPRRARAAKTALDRIGNIAGQVVDAATAAPLADVMVEVQNSGHSTRTDQEGRFVLAGLPVGRQALFVSTIGYALARPNVDVQADATATVTVPLTEGTGAYTERVTVTADRVSDTGPAPPAQQVLGSAALQGVRMVLVDDPLRAVQALPGVAANDDFRSDFSVRGADFRHLGLSIDGVATPWLLHSFEETQDAGSIAMLNSDIFERVTLASGAYPQRYSDRSGGWLEAEMREGSREKAGVRLAVSGTNTSFLAEGPVGGAGKGSWLVSIRRSYIDWLVRQVVSDFADSIFGFTDVQAKFVYDLTPLNQLQVMTITGISRLTQDKETHPASLGHAANNVGLLTVALRSTLGSSAIVTQRASAVAQHFRNQNPYNDETADGHLRDFTYRSDVTWMPKAAALVEAGAQYERQRAGRTIHEYTLLRDQTTTVPVFLSRFETSEHVPSAFARVVFRPSSRLSISPGARVAHSTVVNETILSPWLQAQMSIGAVTLRGGTGLYHQFPELHQTHGSHAGIGLRSERSLHADLSLEHQISPTTHWQVTLYRRDDDRFLRRAESNFRVIGGRLIAPTGSGPWQNSLTGTSSGAEILVQRNSAAGLSGWMSYSLGHSRYRDVITGEQFDGDLDQRHTVNTFFQYAISSRTSVSGKFRYGSNFPMPGYWQQAGNGRVFVGEHLNDMRVPAYARLDLRVNRVFNYTKRRLTLFAEVMNALNRDNSRFRSPAINGNTGEVFDYLQDLFPRLPSAGILVEF
jgi:hypothetical protein